MHLSEEEWRTLSLVARLERGDLTVSEVAVSLGVSRRQMQRIRKRVAEQGNLAVVHGNRGRAPHNKTAEAVAERVVELRRGKYQGFNDRHFTEKLVEVEGIDVSRETVRRLLRGKGVSSPRKRRRPKHRLQRERRALPGQMILWDGSSHDWLEGRGPRLCLMGAIDDATGEFLPGAHFTEKEGSVGYLKVFRDIMLSKGIPQTVYADRHSSLLRNDKHWTLEEQLSGRRELTQVGRVLDELRVGIHRALSAQAKGRVERLWGTLQDRLVSELRLVGAKTIGQANKVLASYRPDHNRRFMVQPREDGNAWRRAPSDRTQLLDLCALQYVRKVRKNNTIQIHKHVIQIPKDRRHKHATYADKKVIVKHHLNGHYRVFYDGELLAWDEDGKRPSETRGGARTIRGARIKERQNEERNLRRRNDEDDEDDEG